MKRTFRLALGIGLLVFAFVACSDDDPNEGGSDADAGSGGVSSSGGASSGGGGASSGGSSSGGSSSGGSSGGGSSGASSSSSGGELEDASAEDASTDDDASTDASIEDASVGDAGTDAEVDAGPTCDGNPGACAEDVGAYQLVGTCGSLGILPPGFTLTAGQKPLPVGTSVLVIGSGIANIGVFSVTGGTASVTVLSGTSRLITLTAALPAGATMAMRTTLNITNAFTLNAVTSLPADYVGTGAKSAGTVSSTLILCSST